MNAIPKLQIRLVQGDILNPNSGNTLGANPPLRRGESSSLLGLPIVLVMATASAVVFPFIFWGNPSGHDFEFHLNSWMEVTRQWRQGIIYPAWAALAHYGYGEARFTFYPPISWTLGAILGSFLPWTIVPAAYIWISLALSGSTMFLLARSRLTRSDAIFAAVFYAANPYYLVIIYWRSAFAELLAGALLPLALLFMWRLSQRERESQTVIFLAVIVAAAWLINIPAAIMFSYSLAGFVLISSIHARNVRAAWESAAALLLGLALAAFYLVAAMHEQHWVSLSQVFAPGVRPADNFLFTFIDDPDHNRFNFLVSLVAFSEIVVLAGSVLLSSLSSRTPGSRGYISWILAAWGLWSTAIMFAFASAAWAHLPELKFVQLPWRWLLCLNAALAPLLACAWRRSMTRVFISFVLLTMVTFVWHRIQEPWWDNKSDITEMLVNQQNGHGYEGTDEYVPEAADPYEVPPDAPLVKTQGKSPVQIHIQEWKAQTKLLTVETQQSARVSLRLFNYPSWKVEVNGRSIPTETREVTGQLMIPISPGMNAIRITYATAWDRIIGLIISAIAAFLAIAFAWRKRIWCAPVDV